MKSDYLPRVDIRDMEVKPALCLDFDGTIRYSKTGKFINKPEDIALYDDVEAVIWDHRNRGYLIFGISNQGGVAFNIKTPQQEMTEMDTTLALFRNNPFHLVKTCWHHEGGKNPAFAHRSLFRKPDIGMLAMCEFEAFNAGLIVDWPHSLLVGDRPEDEECAKRAGIDFCFADVFFGRVTLADQK